MDTNKKETMDAYEADVHHFEREFRKFYVNYGIVDLRRFISVLSGSHVLDIGCGPGIYLEAFREHNVPAIGIDLSAPFVERCKSKGFDVQKMDMEDLHFSSGQFDGLWAAGVLRHVPKDRAPALVRGWSRILKPNGLLWVILRQGEGERFEDVPGLAGKKRWVTHYPPNEIEAFFGSEFDIIEAVQTTIRDGRMYSKYLFKKKATGE